MLRDKFERILAQTDQPVKSPSALPFRPSPRDSPRPVENSRPSSPALLELARRGRSHLARSLSRSRSRSRSRRRSVDDSDDDTLFPLTGPLVRTPTVRRNDAGRIYETGIGTPEPKQCVSYFDIPMEHERHSSQTRELPRNRQPQAPQRTSSLHRRDPRSQRQLSPARTSSCDSAPS